MNTKLFALALLFATTVAGAGEFEDGLRYRENKDFKRAFAVFQQAAARGNTAAKRELGFMFYNGQGVAQDNGKAVEWFTKAADHDDVDSQVNLGIMYENGLSVPQDSARSAYWFQRAAEQGHRRSQFRIGEILYRGLGVSRAYVEADKWWRLAMRDSDEFSARMCPIVETAERKMMPDQLAEAQRRADDWVVRNVRK